MNSPSSINVQSQSSVNSSVAVADLDKSIDKQGLKSSLKLQSSLVKSGFGGLSSGFLSKKSGTKSSQESNTEKSSYNLAKDVSSITPTVTSSSSLNGGFNTNRSSSLSNSGAEIRDYAAMMSMSSGSSASSNSVSRDHSLLTAPPALSSMASVSSVVSRENTSANNFIAFSLFYLNVLEYLEGIQADISKHNADVHNRYLTWSNALLKKIDAKFIVAYMIMTISKMPESLCPTARQHGDDTIDASTLFNGSMFNRMKEFFSVIIDAPRLDDYQKIAKSLIVKYTAKYKNNYPFFKVVSLCHINMIAFVRANPLLFSNQQVAIENLKLLTRVTYLEVFCKFALQKDHSTKEGFIPFIDIVPLLRKTLPRGVLNEYIYTDKQTQKIFKAKELLEKHPFLGVLFNNETIYGKIIRAKLGTFTEENAQKRTSISAKYKKILETVKIAGKKEVCNYSGNSDVMLSEIFFKLDADVNTTLNVIGIETLLRDFKDLAFLYETYEGSVCSIEFFVDNFAVFLKEKVNKKDFSPENIFLINEVFLSICTALLAYLLFVLSHEELAAINRQTPTPKSEDHISDDGVSSKYKFISPKDAHLHKIFSRFFEVLCFYEANLLSMYALMDMSRVDNAYLMQVLDCMSFYKMSYFVSKVIPQNIDNLEYCQRANSYITCLNKLLAVNFFVIKKRKIVQKKIWERQVALKSLSEKEQGSALSLKNHEAWKKFTDLITSLARDEYKEREANAREMEEILKKHQEAVKRQEMELTCKKSVKPKGGKSQNAKKNVAEKQKPAVKQASKSKEAIESVSGNEHTTILQECIANLSVINSSPAFLSDNLKAMLALLDEEFFKTEKMDSGFFNACYNMEIVIRYIGDCLEKNFLKKMKKYHEHIYAIMSCKLPEENKLKEASDYFAEHTAELKEVMHESLYFIDKSKYMLDFVCGIVLKDMPKDTQDIEEYLAENMELKHLNMIYEKTINPLKVIVNEYKGIFIDDDLINQCLNKLDKFIRDLAEKKAHLDKIYQDIQYQQNFGFRPIGLPHNPRKPTLKSVRIEAGKDLADAKEQQKIIKANLLELQAGGSLDLPKSSRGLGALPQECAESQEEDLLLQDPEHYKAKSEECDRTFKLLSRASVEINNCKSSLSCMGRCLNFICGDGEIETEDIGVLVVKINS